MSDETELDNMISVTKYGSKNGVITLGDLVQLFYVEKDGQKKTFENFQFVFDSTYLDTLAYSSNMIELFGKDGMIDAGIGDLTNAAQIKNALANLDVKTLKINYNFAQAHTIGLRIVDKKGTGAVNIAFQLTISQNAKMPIEVSINNAYAADAVDLSGIEASYEDTKSSKTLDNILIEAIASTGNKLYIVETSDGYELSETSSNFGWVTDLGELWFEDFWNETDKDFKLNIYPEGIKNSFALKTTINLTVFRNVKVAVHGEMIVTAATPVIDVIKVSRIKGDKTLPTPSYNLLSTNNDLAINDDGNIYVNNQVSFEYGQKSKIYRNISVSIKGHVVGTTEIECKLGFDFDTFAKSLTHNEIIDGETKTYVATTVSDGIFEYIYLPFGGTGLNAVTWDWNFSSALAGSSSLAIERFDQLHTNEIYRVRTNLYTVDGTTLMFDPDNNRMINHPLYGYDNKAAYIIFQIRQGANSHTVASCIVPVIISHASTTGEFVRYGSQDLANSFKLALTDGDTLISEGNYLTLSAGRTYNIAHDENSAASGFIYSDRYKNEVSRTYEIVRNDENIIYDLGDGTITFNHLNISKGPVFAVIRMTVRYLNRAQSFFYAFCVEPDVEVQKPIYAYDGGAQYVEIENGQAKVYLNEIFGDDTLYPNKTRFNVEDLNGNNINDQVAYTDKIESVTVENNTATKESDWINYANISITNSNLVVKDFTNLVENKEITIVISRNYDGGSEKALSIVGGKATYTFVINPSKDFALEYEELDNIVVDGNDATITVSANDGQFNVTTAEKLEDFVEVEIGGQTYYLSKKDTTFYRWEAGAKIYQEASGSDVTTGAQTLKSTYVVENSNGGTAYNIGTEENPEWLRTSEAEEIINRTLTGNMYTFNKDTAVYVKNGNTYEITSDVRLTEDYEYQKRIDIKLSLKQKTEGGGSSGTGIPINKDLSIRMVGENEKGVDFEYDTRNGILSILTPNFLAQDTTYECLLYTTYGLTGKLTVNMKASIQVELNETKLNVAAGQSYSIADFVTNKEAGDVIEITSADDTKFKVENGKITFYSTFTSYDITLAASLTRGENAVNFQIPLKVNPNLTVQDNIYKEVFANSTTAFDASTFINGLSEEGTLSDGTTITFTFINTEASSVIPGSATEAENVVLNPSTVGKSGSRENLIVTAHLSTGETQEIPFSVLVKCSGTVTVNYPSPAGTALDAEYLEVEKNGVTFDAGNFFNSNAVFAAGNRVVREKVNSAEEAEKIITIKEIYNATLTNGINEDGNDRILTNANIGANIDETQSLTFNKTSTLSEGRVVFTINYNGYEEDYTVILVDNALSIVINAQNPTEDNGSISEDFYVENLGNDKAIFAQNRMAKLSVRLDAPTGEYIALFDEKEVPFTINESDRGKIKYVDGKGALVGYEKIYSASDEDQNDIWSTLLTEKPTTTSRIVLTYNGVEVSYDKYKSITINGLKLYEYEFTTNGIDAQTSIKKATFKYSDGRDVTKDFDLNYSYYARLDIAANTASVGEKNFIIHEMTALKDTANLFEVIGLKRRSTGTPITNLRGINATVNVSFTPPDADSELFNNARQAILKSNKLTDSERAWFTELGDKLFDEYYDEAAKAADTPFIRHSPVTEDGKDIIWNIFAYGATNYGNYNLVTVTYSVGTYSKVFYVIFKSVPDYVLELNEGNAAYKIGETPSNKENMLEIRETVLDGDTNPGVNLTRDYIVVKHGSNQTNVSTNFTYTLKYNEPHGTEFYNNETNVTQKLGTVKEIDKKWTIAPLDWEKIKNKKNETIGLQKKGAIENLGINPAIFGTKQFMLEAIDTYGFNFRFFFEITSQTTPTITGGNLTLIENETFEIGASATYINIAETGSENNNEQLLTYTSKQEDAAASGGKKLINIAGLQNHIVLFNNTDYFEKNDDTNLYELKTTPENPVAGTTYYNWAQGTTPIASALLEASKYPQIKVESIEFRVGNESAGSVTIKETDSTNLRVNEGGQLLGDRKSVV